MSEFTLKWGIVGCGKIAQDFATALKSSAQSKYHVLSGCCDLTLDVSLAYAQRFEVSHYYKSINELLAESHCNIVYIATSNNTHKEACLKAIAAGKHVLCEKPMTMNAKEQEQVLSAAESAGVFFMEALFSRFFPCIQKLKSCLDQHEIGQVKCVFSSRMCLQPRIPRLFSKELGGGGLLDVGIYPIQFACMVFNHEKPVKIVATGHLDPESGVDECGSITLLYSNQRMAVLSYSISSAAFLPSFVIGDKGTLQLPEHSFFPTELILPDGSIFEAPLPQVNDSAAGTAQTHFQNRLGLIYQAEAVRLAIADGLKEHPLVTHEHSRLVTQIMDEVRKQLGYELLVD